jgi:DNA-binding NarL/FixJ family response regulator
MIRILLADDHPIVREGLRAVLETQADFEVVAEAASGDEALRLTLTLLPDILLLDLEMPVLDGVETIRRLRQQQPAARVIVFTAFDNDERIIHAVQAGANGYLLKGSPREEIFRAIRVTMEGGSLLQPTLVTCAAHSLNRSLSANLKCSTCWPRGCRIRRSRPNSLSANVQPNFTSVRLWANWAPPTVPKPSPWPPKKASSHSAPDCTLSSFASPARYVH